LKKCKPMNRSTRLVAVIISVMIKEDVLLQRWLLAYNFIERRVRVPFDLGW
jgi:hypothetical protein